MPSDTSPDQRPPFRLDWRQRCRSMIDEQIRARGINDDAVLDAMLAVPRHLFLPEESWESAYEDRAMPIGQGQTISQPYIVAYMTHALDLHPDCVVLEIGTGTGYQTAILAMLARHVYSLERLPPLMKGARESLQKLGVENATLYTGDGTLGLPRHAPYDRILVTAAAPRVPPPLTAQLADAGRLVAPVGAAEEQTIVLVTRDGQRLIETPALACRFVKLVGEEGWPDVEPAE